jgi:hypothetical protein
MSNVIERYWASCAARDWVTFGQLLADEVVYDLPQTRERCRGRENYVRFNAEYPGDWRLEPVSIVVEGDRGASWIQFTVGDEPATAATFFDLDERGLITRITDFWPEPYEPPSGREHLVERY